MRLHLIAVVLCLLRDCESYNYGSTDVDSSQRPGNPYASGVSGAGSTSGQAASGQGASSPFAMAGSGGVGMGGSSTGMGGSGMGKGGSGAGMPSPFTTGGHSAGTGSGQNPFSMGSTGSGQGSGNGQGHHGYPLDMSKFASAGDIGPLNAAHGMASGQGMKSPFDTSATSGGGPGSMTGGNFASDLVGSDGPGGLAGGSFSIGTDSSGPGGLAGGAFDVSAGLGSAGDSSRYDTNDYQAMVQEQFNTGLYEPGLTGSSYSGDMSSSASGSTSGSQDSLVDYDKNPYYSVGSFSVASGSGWDSSTSQGVADAGKGTGANPFDTSSYSSDTGRPFVTSHTGSGYNTGMSHTGSSYNTGISHTGSSYNTGLSHSGNSYNTGVSHAGSSYNTGVYHAGSSDNTGMSGHAQYTDSMLDGETGVGVGPFSSSYGGSTGTGPFDAQSTGQYGSSFSSGTGSSYGSSAAYTDEHRYGNPFDAPYSELVSNPISSHSNNNQGYSTYGGAQGGSVSSPFSAGQSMSTTGFNHFSGPAGDPSSQKGSTMGFNHNGGSVGFNQLRGRRMTSYLMNALLKRR